MTTRGHGAPVAAVLLLPAPSSGPFGALWQQLLRGIIPSWRAARAERRAGGGAVAVRSILASCPPPRNPQRDAALRSAAGQGLGPPPSGNISSSSSIGESMPEGCRAAAVSESLQQWGAAPAPQGGSRSPQPSEPWNPIQRVGSSAGFAVLHPMQHSAGTSRTPHGRDCC